MTRRDCLIDTGEEKWQIGQTSDYSAQRPAPQPIEGRGMNIRWDAVVDPAAVERHRAAPRLWRPVIDPNADSIRVRVQLFGALAALSSQQAVQLALPAGATVADVIAMLGDRLGETFPTYVIDASGAKRRHCRLFVAGYPVEDLQTPLDPAIEPTEIEIILLISPEGG
jgi:molybdopterin converting factor small subunit